MSRPPLSKEAGRGSGAAAAAGAYHHAQDTLHAGTQLLEEKVEAAAAALDVHGVPQQAALSLPWRHSYPAGRPRARPREFGVHFAGAFHTERLCLFHTHPLPGSLASKLACGKLHLPVISFLFYSPSLPSQKLSSNLIPELSSWDLYPTLVPVDLSHHNIFFAKFHSFR